MLGSPKYLVSASWAILCFRGPDEVISKWRTVGQLHENNEIFIIIIIITTISSSFSGSSSSNPSSGSLSCCRTTFSLSLCFTFLLEMCSTRCQVVYPICYLISMFSLPSVLCSSKSFLTPFLLVLYGANFLVTNPHTHTSLFCCKILSLWLFDQNSDCHFLIDRFLFFFHFHIFSVVPLILILIGCVSVLSV